MIATRPSVGNDELFNIMSAPLHYCGQRPGAIAATADGASFTYGELCTAAALLGSWLVHRSAYRLAILGSRSLGGFVGVLGAAWAGAAYVPLSLKAPSTRIASMLAQARCDALLVDRHGARLIGDELLAFAPQIIAADEQTREYLEPKCGNVPILSELKAPHVAPASVTPTQTAYIMFTSGTTGVPKGVSISVGARAALIRAMRERYDIKPEDRVAETSDLSWDVSVANMILAWDNGASLHALTAEAMIAPARFIRANAITVWLSVPSVITTLMKRGALRYGIFPSLRYSLFVGEGLSVHAAAVWQDSAPESIIENLYGPVEATFACMGHRFEAADAIRGKMVSIGRPYSTAEAAILGEDGRFLGDGETGELLLGGAQLGDGYLDRDELTRERFPTIADRRWYRTGDVALRDSDGRYHHLGRIDNQLKVRGYRVELEDVEAQLRAVSDAISVAAIGWPHGASTADYLIAFVVGGSKTPEALRAALTERLPAYMVPGEIHAVETLPLSANGKLDRARLPELLQVGVHG